MARVAIDPAGAKLMRYLALAIGIAVLASAAMRFVAAPTAPVTPQVPTAQGGPTQQPQGSPVAQVPTAMTALLLPTLELCVSVDDLEARWSKALAKELRGEQEFQIEGGRIDVVTPRFAIEVDFLRKWHEGIGQALHYASSTGKLPMVALILPESAQSISASTLETLSLIERLASEQRIRLLLLSPRNC